MARIKTAYVCNSCGAHTPKWAGQCSDCHQWNTLNEEAVLTAPTRFTGYAGSQDNRVCLLSDVNVATAIARMSTELGEFDRVLGGGIVAGSVVLLGGDPGIGKSTLLLQTLCTLAQTQKVLYVTGEESLQQIAMRANRLGLPTKSVHLLAETHIENLLSFAAQEKPNVMVIDSIQTAYSEALSSSPGSVSQVRESAARLVRFAKQSGCAVFLVGHVTKDGALAGPRVLEHMVDTVLYFEGDSNTRFRLLRAIKNRFGAVNELGLFAMTETGLKPVNNPSALFLSQRPEPVPGSAVMVTWEGTRPLLVEVQALVDRSYLPQPKRIAVGLEQNRLALLLAVLHRHAGVVTYDQDVFSSVVGGIKVSETAADLPLLMAILSSLHQKLFPQDTVIFGEVGLAGEIRAVQRGQERLQEAFKQGFKRAIIPKANMPKEKEMSGQIIGVSRLQEALDYFV